MTQLSAPSTRVSWLSHRWTQRLLVWGGLLGLWQYGATRLGSAMLPRPTDVILASLAMIGNDDLLTLLVTMQHMVVGFVIASLVGVAIGILIGASPLANAVLGVTLRTLFIAPFEATLPFLIIVVGTQFNYRVTVVFLFAVFPIVFNTASGLRSVDRDLRETAAAFCTPRHAMITQIVLPAVLPYILAGLRLGLANAFKGMIIAELWIIVGTGKKLMELGSSRKLDEYFAFVVWIVLIAAVLNRGMWRLERWCAPWRPLSDRSQP